MTTFDKNIPLPKETRGSRQQKYEWGEMEIGDSFTINYREKVSIYSSVRYYNENNGTTIKIKTAKEGEGVYRCWRVE